jgi:hypothetical protein
MNRLRRWKRNCCLVLLAGALLLILLCAALFILIYRAQAQGPVGPAVDVLLLIDHSNSMWDKGGVGSDPDMLRVQAAHLFIAYLGVDTTRAGNRLGVIHFGGRSELVVPLTPLDSAAQRQAIRAAIANPHRLEWTDPLEALQLAYETLFPQGQGDPVRQPAVILLTDGKPERSPTPSPDERAAYVADLRALVDRFRERGCPIFTIALSNEATDRDPEIQTVYRNLWQEISARTPPAEYHEARTADDLLRIYHAVVARLAGAEIGAPVVDTPVEGQATRTITVEAGLARMTLVVMRSDPALEVRLLRPGGAPARPTDPDVRHTGDPGATREEIWTITDPRPGRWTLELQGHGTVLAWRDTIPQPDARVPTYAIEAAALPSYVPAGQPLEVAGITVHELSTGEAPGDERLDIVVEIHRAGFVEAMFLARDGGQGCDSEANDGHYCVVLPDPPPGACTLHLRALLDGVEIARREVVFEAIPLPRLEIVSPPAGTSIEPAAPIDLKVRVWSGERALGTEELAAQGMLTASLQSAGAGAVAIPLTEIGGRFVGRRFVGQCTAPDHPGLITLTVRLHGQTPEGLPFEDLARVPLEVTLPKDHAEAATRRSAQRSRPGRILPLAGLVVLATAAGIGGLLVRRHRTRATLDGSFRVLAAPPEQPAGEVLDLPAVPSAILGGTGKKAIQLPGEVPRAVLRAGRTPEGDVETWIAPPAGIAGGELTLNEHPLETARRLRDGDVLTLGAYRLRFESLRQASARRAQHRPRRKMDRNGGMR